MAAIEFLAPPLRGLAKEIEMSSEENYSIR